jgi:hypothetical protein
MICTDGSATSDRVPRNLFLLLATILLSAISPRAPMAATATMAAATTTPIADSTKAITPADTAGKTDSSAMTASAATPSDAAPAAVDNDKDAEPGRTGSRKLKSIAYPNGALYMRRGITGAFLGGQHKNQGEGSLYQWQGELGYFYTPYFSGGTGFKITAGEPSDSAQKIFNRYFLNVRLHHAWDAVAIYAGLQLGMGNLNILTSSPSDSLIKAPIKNTKPTLGLDLGGGWKFSRYIGFTLGNNIEYSLVDEAGVGTTNALNIHVNPGLALDILAFTDNLNELVPAFYFYFEFQRGFLIFEKGNRRQDQSGVLGVGLAF